ncbi:hypothetical protein JK223_16465, partial [Tatumella sp. JGM118]|nr:hypothetical protein [Tatumella sp. JGM118]
MAVFSRLPEEDGAAVAAVTVVAAVVAGVAAYLAMAIGAPLGVLLDQWMGISG